MKKYQGFDPVIDENSKVLILGSFPSVKSREQGFYYGNPQNRFWKVLGLAIQKQVPESVTGRKSFLLENGVALWDMIESTDIEGSMDADINDKNSQPVDFNRVLSKFPNLKLIILNGKKAFSVFEKFNKDCKIEYVYLPSTSPANVSFNTEKWITTLKKVLN